MEARKAFLAAATEALAPRLLLADSFRVRINPRTAAAEVRGWAHHLNRFRAGVDSIVFPEATPKDADLAEFLADAAFRISAYGEGFPRLELWGEADGQLSLSLSLRALPPLGDTIEMQTAEGVILEHPERKGPNIERLSVLNRQLGAEALLLDAAGHVLEGATTSLIWWHPLSGAGFRTEPLADRRGRVSSITERIIAQIASPGLLLGRITPSDLARHEVWAVNALHGIRLVSSIDGAPTASADSERLTHYRQRLDRSWQEVRPPA